MPEYFVDFFTDNDPTSLTSADRTAPTDMMRQFSTIGQCEALNFAEIGANNQPTAPLAGYNLGDVPLGDGRPFALGSTDTEREDWIISYVGSYFTKTDALYFLSSNRAWFPRTDFLSDPRVYNIGWYRLFPEEVGGIMKNFITQNYPDLGPLVDPNGNFVRRDLIDVETGEAPDYTGYSRVLPTIAFNHQYYAALYSLALLSDNRDSNYDLSKSMLIAVEGAEDDFGLFDSLLADASTEDMVVTFEHPVSGKRIRAVDPGNGMAIAADLLRKANLYKERYLTLKGCQDGTIDPATTPYCHCVTSIVENDGQLFCAQGLVTEAPGTGFCGEYELGYRVGYARETLDDAVDFIDDVRFLSQIFRADY